MRISATSQVSIMGPSAFVTTTTATTARKTVTFRPTVTAHLVLHITDYSICERCDAWYGSANLLCMRKKVEKLAKQIDRRDGHLEEKEGKVPQSQNQNGGTKWSTATCDGSYYYHFHRNGYSSFIRGVERKTKRGGTARTQNKNQALMAVFREQYLQWKLDVQDPESLAQLYSNASRTCQKEALWMGLIDAAEVHPQQQVAAHQYAAHQYNDDVECRNDGLPTIDQTIIAAFPSLMDSRAMTTMEKEEFGIESKCDSLGDGGNSGEDVATTATTTTMMMKPDILEMKMVSITNAAA